MREKRGKGAPDIFEEIKESPPAHDLTDLSRGNDNDILEIDQLFCSSGAHSAVYIPSSRRMVVPPAASLTSRGSWSACSGLTLTIFPQSSCAPTAGIPLPWMQPHRMNRDTSIFSTWQRRLFKKTNHSSLSSREKPRTSGSSDPHGRTRPCNLAPSRLKVFSVLTPLSSMRHRCKHSSCTHQEIMHCSLIFLNKSHKF